MSEANISNDKIDAAKEHRVGSDAPFYGGMIVLGSVYVLLIVGMILADLTYTSPGDLLHCLKDEKIQYSIKLSLLSCTVTTILSLWVAIPIGYLLSRYNFRGKAFLDALLDIPIVLPPLVIGLSLLILFRTSIGQYLESLAPHGITYEIPSVIIAQFAVACAFAVRTMRATFDQISPRQEQVALTMGCTRSQAFWAVVLPDAAHGVLTAGTLAWARAMGEFGPILIFSGTTRMKTEVMPSSVFLEMSIGNIEAALAVSLLMVMAALVVLVLVRVFGSSNPGAVA